MPRRRTLLILPILLAAWSLLAVWQYQEYHREGEASRQTEVRQAQSIMKALLGGLRSHRRLGYVECERLRDALEEMVLSDDILAAAILAEDGRPIAVARSAAAQDATFPQEIGTFWDDAHLRYAVEFQVEPMPPGGGGGGGGRGPGWGRLARGLAEEDNPWAGGGTFRAVLLLDRSSADAAASRAFWNRAGLVLAGTLVLTCVAVAWAATIRLADARGRTRVLETEARHLRDLSQAAAGLAHETRNPLGLIRGWAQRLADSGLSPPQQKQAAALIEECDRVTSRINQFLAFAKPSQPRPEPIALDGLVAELGVLLEPDLESKQLKLLPDPSLGGSRILADRELLRMALFNLLRNAVQFSPSGACIEIARRRGQNGESRVEVADRGCGVAPEEAELLFTPYFTTRSDGTGLGLAIVRRIAAAHGWQAGYSPRPGGGSIFWLDGIHG